MTYEMLREKRDRVDAALAKLREDPSVRRREAGDDVLDEFMVANDAKEAADIDVSSKRDIESLEKERARLTVLMDFARPALEGLSSKATPAAVAPPPEPAPEAPDPAAVAPTLPPPKPPAPPKLKVAAPMAPTLPRAPDPEDEEPSKRRKKKKRRVMGPARGPSSSSALEGGDVDWAPPVGQDGSGRTALNEKFGY